MYSILHVLYNKEPAWGIFVLEISFLFHRQQNTCTNKFRKGTSYVCMCFRGASWYRQIPAPNMEPPNAQLWTMTNATEIIIDLEATGLGIGTNYLAPLTLTFQFDLLLKSFCFGHYFWMMRARLSLTNLFFLWKSRLFYG